MDTDRNLLFGVLALQADLISEGQFAEACSAWAARKDAPLADLLVGRGWLTPADRADVEKLLDRKLKKHGGDAQLRPRQHHRPEPRPPRPLPADARPRRGRPGAGLRRP